MPDEMIVLVAMNTKGEGLRVFYPFAEPEEAIEFMEVLPPELTHVGWAYVENIHKVDF